SLLALSGIGVSVFKVGALALVGDITRDAREHTSLMNTVEGWFAVGAIVGPALVATLLQAGLSWTWLYVAAACICGLLTLVALRVQYPQLQATAGQPAAASASLRQTLGLLRDTHAL